MTAPRRKLASVLDGDAALRVGLDHLDPDYIGCRDTRHWWETMEDYHLVDTDQVGIQPRQGHSKYVRRVIECQRCHTRRVEAYAIVERQGWTMLHSIGATYDYPDGYQLKGLPSGVRSSAELVRGLIFDRMQERPRKRAPRKTSRPA